MNYVFVFSVVCRSMVIEFLGRCYDVVKNSVFELYKGILYFLFN